MSFQDRLKTVYLQIEDALNKKREQRRASIRRFVAVSARFSAIALAVTAFICFFTAVGYVAAEMIFGHQFH